MLLPAFVALGFVLGVTAFIRLSEFVVYARLAFAMRNCTYNFPLCLASSFANSVR